MIRNFYRYICYVTYRIACKSTTKGGSYNKFFAYLNFLTLSAIFPALILTLKFRNHKYFSFLHILPERSIFNLLLHSSVFIFPSMLLISLFIKKSYLENLVVSDKEIKKNKYILWGIIFLFIAYYFIKGLIK